MPNKFDVQRALIDEVYKRIKSVASCDIDTIERLVKMFVDLCDAT